jgi:hypothetical protein
LLDARPTSATAAARRILWAFFRDPKNGLPLASLNARTQWQPALKARLPGLLSAVSAVLGCAEISTWSKRITVAGLADTPLAELAQSASGGARLGARTVHDAKGESIPAVVYLARKADLEALVQGPFSEDGRIGYVAVTRAMDLLLVGVPKGANSCVDGLTAKGIGEWPSSAPVPIAG